MQGLVKAKQQNSLQVVGDEQGLKVYSVQDVLKQVELVQELMKKVMKEGEHYGVIPGTKKPTLYKPGAEKLGFTFRLMPEYEIHKTDLGNGHREYEVVCKLYHIQTGAFVGAGVGSCSTMESKYRWRAKKVETGEPIPKDYHQNKGKYKAEGYRLEKDDTGAWHWYKIDGKQENPDIADTWNTVLKIAKKRAHIDAILTATAASDIFTQDMEDIQSNIKANEDEDSEPQTQPRPKKKPDDEDDKARIVGNIIKLCVNKAVKETNLPEDDKATITYARGYLESATKKFDIVAKTSDDLMQLRLSDLNKIENYLEKENKKSKGGDLL